MISSEEISPLKPPALGDSIIVNHQEYTLVGTSLGYCLVKDGKKNMSVGVHNSLRSLIESIRSHNVWNTRLSRQRTRDLARRA